MSPLTSTLLKESVKALRLVVNSPGNAKMFSAAMLAASIALPRVSIAEEKLLEMARRQLSDASTSSSKGFTSYESKIMAVIVLHQLNISLQRLRTEAPAHFCTYILERPLI
ncbi:PREDICTED: uncharacterized protein LOC106811778 [Priapulus caudatus]|uniref:Uncharacterized protein LOC106811778 n=1 Tax=Priapulus caudatus TaxID=37621 RepID=A0ABM1EFL0_PRICU|nr:PREDICTED: uncharacterized protein LOC106811778 [Priapulus caudatus]